MFVFRFQENQKRMLTVITSFCNISWPRWQVGKKGIVLLRVHRCSSTCNPPFQFESSPSTTTPVFCQSAIILSSQLCHPSSLKWLYSKLELTQEFVVDCAHALWVVHSTKRLVSLMLLKWFLSDSFIYFMYRMLKKSLNRLVMCMDTVAALPHAHIDSLHTHTMDKFMLSTVF